jgi:hypothetical protein
VSGPDQRKEQRLCGVQQLRFERLLFVAFLLVPLLVLAAASENPSDRT